jgi:hypothetical protein
MQNKTELAFPMKKTASAEKVTIKKDTVEMKFSIDQSKQDDTSHEQLPHDDDSCDICKSYKVNTRIGFLVFCNLWISYDFLILFLYF